MTGDRSQASHGVMFHHFYSDHHPRGQGAISADDLDRMIGYLSSKFEILSPDEYIAESSKNNLHEGRDICLTFDDALLCQYEIALPVLQAHDLKAFYFVYSSAFSGQPDPLEVYRYFRTIHFENFEDFHYEFEEEVRSTLNAINLQKLDEFKPESYLVEFPFYSLEDRSFRFMRNELLTSNEYKLVMGNLMGKHNFLAEDVTAKLYMNESHIRHLSDEGNVVGLHSHTHPTMIHNLTREQQEQEYDSNLEFLKATLGSTPSTMSHPCGNYSSATLDVLRDREVTLGFRSNLAVPRAPSLLEIPREDHANIMQEMDTWT